MNNIKPDQLLGLKVDINVLFKQIATYLPQVEISLKNTSSAVSEVNAQLIKPIDDLKNSSNGLSTTLTQVEAESDALANWILEFAGHIFDLLGGLGEVGRRTHQVRLIALNASAAAARYGEEGRGYEVLTFELGNLSRSIMISTEALRRDNRKAEEVPEEYALLAVGLKEECQQILQSLEQLLEQSTKRVEETIYSAKMAYNDIQQIITSFNLLTNQLMNNIQKEDIYRQTIEHLTAVVTAMNSQNANLDEQQSIIAVAGILVKELTESIFSELSELKDTTKAQLTSIMENLKNLGSQSELKKNALNFANNIEAEICSMTSILPKAQAILDKLVSHQKDDSLYEIVDDLKRNIRDFEEHTETLRIICSLMKIEVARMSVQDQASAITNDILMNADDFTSIVKIADLKTNRLSSNLEEFAVSSTQKREKLTQMMDKKQRNFKISTEAVFNSSKHHLQSIENLTKTVDQDLNEFHKILNMLNRLDLDAIRELGEKCEEAAIEARIDLEKRNIEVVIVERLEALINGFTVYSQKQKAATTLSLNVEEGDDEGSLTLF